MSILTPIQYSIREKQSNKTKPISEKPHDRRTELGAYRRSITLASDQLIISAQVRDKEGMELWNQIIDNAQEKIAKIIKEEDQHSYQQYGNYANLGNTAMKAADKAVDIGGRIIKISAAANIGSQLASSQGPQLHAVA